MAEVLAILIIVYALKSAIKDGREHWGKAKAANRSESAGKSKPRRAASAVQHDIGYWASQVAHGFPPARHGFASGWHAGRTAQEQGKAAREKAKADHLHTRASALEEIREHRKRTEEALERIRKAQGLEPESVHAKPDEEAVPVKPQDETPAARPADEQPAPEAAPAVPEEGRANEGEGSPEDASPADETAPPPTEGSNGMPSQTDTTYTEQLDTLTKIRDEAERELHRAQARRAANILDSLTGLGLDHQTLSDAATMDDAFRKQVEAAREALEAANQMRNGLIQRHGGIQEATDNSPVLVPAEPGFYAR